MSAIEKFRQAAIIQNLLPNTIGTYTGLLKKFYGFTGKPASQCWHEPRHRPTLRVEFILLDRAALLARPDLHLRVKPTLFTFTQSTFASPAFKTPSLQT
jgi:hypothetical protein